ncbi:MAG: Gfo/Idh/MocA family oxidoreductase [Cyclobacteriaceae bacterium]|jgi:threonine dehydrogenase-like Zn-dependent dehydrogenase|nr:Gfo/Idh/MocA family oxidoreductase [Cyclobacteriaceae bacterium]
MKSNRRKFIQNLALGTGAVAAGIPSFAFTGETPESLANGVARGNGRQTFNMSGYAAPKLDVVRIGIIGLGNRGSGAVARLSRIEGVEITVLCDKYPDRIARAQERLAKSGRPKAKEFSGEEGWKAVCESKDVDLVYTPTPWDLHTPIAVLAMKNGKHAAVEVPAAVNIDQCWELVETSEATKKHCMMLENTCYDFFELLTLNMVRNGLLGEVVHAEGAYLHDLSRGNLFDKKGYADMWRLKENIGRNGNLYPTHGLGPIAQCMNINRGDRMEKLVSMSSDDFTLNAIAKELAAEDAFFKEYVDKPYRGNMNTSIIRTARGKTIMNQHDVSTLRPYSRIHLVSGTKGIVQKYPEPERVAFGHEWASEAELKELYDKYTPPIVKHIGEMAKQVGGHGGMDFIMDWRLIDCLRNGLPLDQDVYDAAAWTAAGVLSETSVAKGFQVVDFPDFTRGAWKTNKPVNLTLEGGATTTVRAQ